MADRTIRINVVGDSRSLQSALKTSEKSLASLDRSAAKSQQGIAKLESGFSSFGKGAALVAGASAISSAFLQVVDAASKLQTAQAANQRIWGANAASMQQAAEAAGDYGLAQADYLQTAAKLGSQLRNLGADQDTAATSAQSLMRMGENLAAVFGTDVPSAVGAISAALRGEFDPLEQYGIGITAASVAARMAADGISKAEATIAIAMEQSTSTIGAAAAAQDTFAGKQRALTANFENAKAAIGEGFLPAASAAVDVLNTLAKAVQAIPDGLKSLAGTAIAAAAAVKGLQMGLGIAATRTGRWAESLAASEGYVANGAKTMGRLTTALQKVGNALPIVGAAVIALGEGFTFLIDRAKEASVSQEDLVRQLSTGQTAAVSQVAQQVRAATDAYSGFGNTVLDVIGTVTGLGGIIGSLIRHDEGIAAQESIDRLNRSLDELMTLSPATGAAAVRAAYQALIDGGLTADEATQHLAGSLARADQILAQYSPDVVDAAAKTQALTAAFDAASTRATAFGDALHALFAGLDVDVAMQNFREALDGIKEAAKGGFDASEIQALNQAWTNVSQSMMQAGASTGQIIARYDSMRAAARRALADVGITGREAGRILDQAFGKRYEVVASIKANADPAVDQAKRAQQALNYIKQKSPAGIWARWLGRQDTSRADRDINGVRQNRPASIDADPGPAVQAAGTARDALNAASGTYSATLNIALNQGPGVQAWIDRLWGGGQWYDWAFGDEDMDMFGPQLRAADPMAPLRKALGVGKKAFRVDVILNLKQEGDWSAAIANLDKLQRLASQTNDKGKPTRLARLAQAELKSRRAELKVVQQYIATAKVRFGTEMVGYATLKQRLDEARAAMGQLANELADAINGVNLGQAWQNVISRRGDLTSQIGDLRGQLEEFRRAAAESFNPNVVAYYNRRIRETQAEMNRLATERAGTNLRSQLQQQLARTAQFTRQLEQLRGALSPEALAELARQGPEAGVDIARELLADPKLRQTYNRAYGDAAKFSKEIGVELAQDVYRPQIEAITTAIDQLREKIRKWLKEEHPEVKATINFTRWKLPKARDLPAWVTSTERQLNVDQHVNVTVQGMVADPEGTARAIRRLLRDSANRNGSVQWAGAR